MIHTHTSRYIFSDGHTFFLFLLIYGGLGFWGWDHGSGFWGFQLGGSGSGVCGLLGFLGFGLSI